MLCKNKETSQQKAKQNYNLLLLLHLWQQTFFSVVSLKFVLSHSFDKTLLNLLCLVPSSYKDTSFGLYFFLEEPIR